MAVGMRSMMQAIAAAVVALALAACSTSSGSAPPAETAQSSPSFGQKVENLLLLGDTNPPPAKTAEEQDKTKVFCPELAIQPGTASYQLFLAGHTGDPFSQRYQARFGRLARECNVNGNSVTIRIGFAGRLIVGPKGDSGQTLTLPIRIVLLDYDDKPVFSRLEQVAVSIPPASGGADFSQIVTSDAIPLPPDRMAGWRLRIGFDTGKAEKPARGGHHRRAHKAG
ncbi:MAG TPA: hypothetical protein VHD15_18120 [Hyphomicrobiales bacterium]|nr:hypothetical protein [Hyphomicrobiales bacterium]